MHVSPLWLSFAQENGAPGLNEDAVIGRPLWEFIADEPTRDLYERIHVRARKTAKPVVVAYRCDSPSLRREMRLTISPAENGELSYSSVLLRAVPQGPIRVLDSGLRGTGSFVTMCSCCKRSLIEPHGWVDLEDVSLRLRVLGKARLPGLRYTVCPECVSIAQDRDGNGDAA